MGDRAMKKVVVASGNPVKIQATLNAFSRMFAPGRFEVDGAKVASGVGAQPMSDVEALTPRLWKERFADQTKKSALDHEVNYALP